MAFTLGTKLSHPIWPASGVILGVSSQVQSYFHPHPKKETCKCPCTHAHVHASTDTYTNTCPSTRHVYGGHVFKTQADSAPTLDPPELPLPSGSSPNSFHGMPCLLANINFATLNSAYSVVQQHRTACVNFVVLTLVHLSKEMPPPFPPDLGLPLSTHPSTPGLG